MQIDWSISVGNLLTVLGFLSGGFWFITTMKTEIVRMEDRLARLELIARGMTDALVELARHGERFAAIELRLNESIERIESRLGALEQRISTLWSIISNIRNKVIVDKGD